MDARTALAAFLALITGFFTLSPATADNGQLAQARPAEPVTIDGDLSDWPDGLTRMPIAFDSERALRPGSENFEAFWRVAFDPEAGSIDIALEVRDDVHHVAETDEGGWGSGDSAILYLDLSHDPRGSGAGLLAASGPHRWVLTPTDHWDPAAAELGWEDAHLAVKRTGTTTRYEWRIETGRPLSPDRSIGIDFLLNDHDGPDAGGGTTLYSWGPGFGKSQAGGRLGDLLLLETNRVLNRLEGQVEWSSAPVQTDGTLRPLPPQRVRLQHEDKPGLWLQASADEQGRYALEVPDGRWRLSLPDRAFGDVWTDDFMMLEASEPVSIELAGGQGRQAPTLRTAPLAPPELGEEEGRLFSWTKAQEPGLEATVRALMAHYQVPGVSLALVHKGKLAYHGTFGTRNAAQGEPVTPETVFEAASITKIVFAFAVNRLAERGVIDLDRPLHEYLAFEELAYDDRYLAITARQVLSHQSGMPNWRWMNDDGKIDLKFDPGTQFGYSGEGYEYLGRVVAKLTGKPLEVVLLEEVQQPMGFEARTYFSDSEALRAVASRGHWWGMAGPHSFAGEPGMAFSMVTEAAVFSRFMEALIARQGLSRDAYEAMLSPESTVPREAGDDPAWPGFYGLGFHLAESPFGRVFGHGGNNGDFMCQFEIYDAHGAGFIVFTNGNTGVRLINDLRRYLVTARGMAQEGHSIARVD